MKARLLVCLVLVAIFFGCCLLIAQKRFHAFIPSGDTTNSVVRTVASKPKKAQAAPASALSKQVPDNLTRDAADDFFDLTDKWMSPSGVPPSMKDVEGFVAAFRRVSRDRKDECIHRALNLVPDENVMLLAGILMDKAEDKEIVETVFNDILNRDEEVKKPILKEIFKDKTHPCWADTAWILDVTGELPAKK